MSRYESCCAQQLQGLQPTEYYFKGGCVTGLKSQFKFHSSIIKLQQEGLELCGTIELNWRLASCHDGPESNIKEQHLSRLARVFELAFPPWPRATRAQSEKLLHCWGLVLVAFCVSFAFVLLNLFCFAAFCKVVG